ncbi:MAG: magnesium/cobalt transporter CorA [Candidatus Altiarchaeales archaeon]|nr:magnesium/cobalt transporter CorA [Candidatus Altiarchaeales archaeon]
MKSKSKGRLSRKSGLPPGTLIHVGERKTDKSRITVINYDEKDYGEFEAEDLNQLLPEKDSPKVSWINVDGIHDVGVVEKIGGYFDIHPLVLEDVLNTQQRPKKEELGERVFVVLRLLHINGDLSSEQISFFVGENFVVSFQEHEGDVFNGVRDRIRTGRGIRKRKADYLLYALIDSIVDNYFLILERFGERIEALEDEILENPSNQTMQRIQGLRKDIISLRRSIWPLREVISGLERSESPLIKKSTGIYFRDVYDHTIQVIDTIESYRDIVSGMLDTYLSSLSNRMNEVMKTLTIIATIFIPLTFIAGVYGMNFKHMPELDYRYGYPLIWFIMAGVAAALTAYFKKKRWL